MATQSIYKKLESLPPTLKEEAKKFIDSLIEKTKKEEPSKHSKPIHGSLRGKIHLADDFDEPLDEFKEYME